MAHGWGRCGVAILLAFAFMGALAESGSRESLAQSFPQVSGHIAKASPMVQAAAAGVYYESTVKNIIQADCARCHSGPTRNLTDYDNLKAYADSGLLAAMVQGPMRRFAGNDAQTILAWVDSGAPEKPGGTVQAQFAVTPAPCAPGSRATPPCAAGPGGLQRSVPSHQVNPHIAKASPMVQAAAAGVYYENTVKNIIQADCARCHSGPTRNLTDYDSLKAYADSGLLATMVQGPMWRFAGNDAQTILAWIDSGAPEKPPGAVQAHFAVTPAPCAPGSGAAPPCAPGSVGPHPNAPNHQITYSNTVKSILAEDCLRCHSDPFRNLTTYENVKAYADNGLLQLLVRRGGPMHRFAGPDARYIIAWADNGAPQ